MLPFYMGQEGEGRSRTFSKPRCEFNDYILRHQWVQALVVTRDERWIQNEVPCFPLHLKNITRLCRLFQSLIPGSCVLIPRYLLQKADLVIQKSLSFIPELAEKHFPRPRGCSVMIQDRIYFLFLSCYFLQGLGVKTFSEKIENLGVRETCFQIPSSSSLVYNISLLHKMEILEPRPQSSLKDEFWGMRLVQNEAHNRWSIVLLYYHQSMESNCRWSPAFTSSCQFSLSHWDQLLFLSFRPFRATLVAYGGSQARGLIGATAAGLHHSHSNAISKPGLRPTPQLTATPDHWPTEQGQASNPRPPGS